MRCLQFSLDGEPSWKVPMQSGCLLNYVFRLNVFIILSGLRKIHTDFRMVQGENKYINRAFI